MQDKVNKHSAGRQLPLCARHCGRPGGGPHSHRTRSFLARKEKRTHTISQVPGNTFPYVTFIIHASNLLKRQRPRGREEVKMTWPESHKQEVAAMLLGWGWGKRWCSAPQGSILKQTDDPERRTDSEEAPVGNLSQSWPWPVLRQARASCLPLHQVSDSPTGKEHFFRYKTGLSHSNYLRQLRKPDARARSRTRAHSRREPSVCSTCPPRGRQGHRVSISSTGRLASDNSSDAKQTKRRMAGDRVTAMRHIHTREYDAGLQKRKD